MFYKIIIFSILFFAGCKTKTSQELININKDFSLKELSFNKTTSEEFEKLMTNKKILFTVKETTPEDYLQNDSIAFCGNDSRLYEFNKIYTNDSLGLIFNFLKSNQQNKYTFYEYEISKFHHIKICILNRSINDKTRLFVQCESWKIGFGNLKQNRNFSKSSFCFINRSFK